MAKKEYNKSLSARIRRRNAQGFEGIGSYNGIGPYPHPYGDYADDKQNHKNLDRKQDIARKNKLGFRTREYKIDNKGSIMYIGKKTRCMSKKYADGHQKLN